MIPKRLLRRLTVGQLQQAIKIKKRLDRVSQLERERDAFLKSAAKLDKVINRLTDGNESPLKSGSNRRTRRKLSRATRLKMAAAARARWAKVKQASGK